MHYENYFNFWNYELKVKNQEYQEFITKLLSLSHNLVSLAKTQDISEVFQATKEFKQHYQSRLLDTVCREQVMYFLFELAKETDPDDRDTKWLYLKFKNY